MLTRAQIQRLAQHHHIGMQVQERDYLQHLLLSILYTRTDALVFKGGTSLRLVYGGSRYSEDLDFNSPEDVASLERHWEAVVAELAYFGVVAQIRNTWTSQMGYSLDVSYQGPLYDGRDHSKGKVRVDLNLRPEPVDTRRELVAPAYDDVRPFVVHVLTPEHLLAEKVRALVVRGKPRDLYDIWLLLRQGIKPDPALIDQKLALYQMVWKPNLLTQSLERVRPDWERDLRPLLSQFVAYEDAVHGVEAMLR